MLRGSEPGSDFEIALKEMLCAVPTAYSRRVDPHAAHNAEPTMRDKLQLMWEMQSNTATLDASAGYSENPASNAHVFDPSHPSFLLHDWHGTTEAQKNRQVSQAKNKQRQDQLAASRSSWWEARDPAYAARAQTSAASEPESLGSHATSAEQNAANVRARWEHAAYRPGDYPAGRSSRGSAHGPSGPGGFSPRAQIPPHDFHHSSARPPPSEAESLSSWGRASRTTTWVENHPREAAEDWARREQSRQPNTNWNSNWDSSWYSSTDWHRRKWRN